MLNWGTRSLGARTSGPHGALPYLEKMRAGGPRTQGGADVGKHLGDKIPGCADLRSAWSTAVSPVHSISIFMKKTANNGE